VFTGSIVEGKRPDLAVKIIQKLIEKGIAAQLELYGEGILRQDLEAYVLKHKLEPYVFFKGNQPLSCIKDALQKAHFLILPSKSEGWPKAIAEAMFFGVIPIATAVSCVPSMLDNGHRGIIIAPSLETAADEIMLTIEGADLNKMAKLAQEWSQKYTLEYFETEIKKLLENPCA
jgi:glycosyltransferase involved in cell wall biosynthesis